MIVLEQNLLIEKLWTLLLLSVRLSGMLIFAPFFSASAITVPIRILLALSVAVVLSASVPVPPLDIVSPVGALTIFREALIGLSIGLLFQFAFATVAMAGEQIAMSMGIGFASMVDPQSGAQSPVITQFLSILLTLIFLTVEGHHVLLRHVGASFTALPIEPTFDSKTFIGIAQGAGLIFSAALLVAMPLIVTLSLANIIIGLLTRVAPQLNIFSIGFPLTILIGLAILLISMPTIATSFIGLIQASSELSRQLILGEAR
jgi:flagellar biosynthetic protein FliR